MCSLGMPSRASGSNKGVVNHRLPFVRVSPLAGQRFRAKIIMGTAVAACVLGPGGIRHRKREGDGATPAGRYGVQRLLFRSDRGPRPACRVPAASIGRSTGWCDDVKSASYNRQVKLPFIGGHERLWREDRLYNLIVVIDHNAEPALKGCGSAIFIHVKAPDGTPTAGCIALEPADLRRLLGRIDRKTRLVIG